MQGKGQCLCASAGPVGPSMVTNAGHLAQGPPVLSLGFLSSSVLAVRLRYKLVSQVPLEDHWLAHGGERKQREN